MQLLLPPLPVAATISCLALSISAAPVLENGPTQGHAWYTSSCPIDWPSGSGRFAPPPDLEISDPVWKHLGHRMDYDIGKGFTKPWIVRRGGDSLVSSISLKPGPRAVKGPVAAAFLRRSATNAFSRRENLSSNTTDDEPAEVSDALTSAVVEIPDHISFSLTDDDDDFLSILEAGGENYLPDDPALALPTTDEQQPDVANTTFMAPPTPDHPWGDEVQGTDTDGQCCRPTWDCVYHMYWMMERRADKTFPTFDPGRINQQWTLAEHKRVCCIAQYKSTCPNPQPGGKHGRKAGKWWWMVGDYKWNWPPKCSNPARIIAPMPGASPAIT